MFGAFDPLELAGCADSPQRLMQQRALLRRDEVVLETVYEQDRRCSRTYVADRACEFSVLSTFPGRATDQERFRRGRIGPTRPVRAHG